MSAISMQDIGARRNNYEFAKIYVWLILYVALLQEFDLKSKMSVLNVVGITKATSIKVKKNSLFSLG